MTTNTELQGLAEWLRVLSRGMKYSTDILHGANNGTISRWADKVERIQAAEPVAIHGWMDYRSRVGSMCVNENGLQMRHREFTITDMRSGEAFGMPAGEYDLYAYPKGEQPVGSTPAPAVQPTGEMRWAGGEEAKKQLRWKPHEIDWAKAAGKIFDAMVAAAPKPAGAQPTADERMRHDYPILQQFHSKHAQGALAAPSCLCCGRQTGRDRPIAVQHMELPAVVICKPCKDASAQPAGAPRGAPLTDERIEFALNNQMEDPTKDEAAGFYAGARWAEAVLSGTDWPIMGGRESLEDALAVVESFGEGVAGLNDTYARQIILAAEVKRLRAASTSDKEPNNG